MNQETHPRTVRSFVRREGRLTTGQARALERWLPALSIPPGDALLDLNALFGRDAPRTLEIGFGDGEALLAMAAAAPDQDFLGIEVHRPGVGHLLAGVERLGLTNVRVACQDAIEVLARIPPQSLDRVLLFFPDPWPKKRHHKRRIVQAAFIERVRERLREGGRFHAATDWQPYAQWMVEVLEQAPGMVNCVAPGAYAPKPDYRPQTKFERRGERLGHGVWDLLYCREG